MGLRLSIDSSESESNGNPASITASSSPTYRRNRSFTENASESCNRSSELDSTTPRCENSSPPIISRLLRQLEASSDNASFLHLLRTYDTGSTQSANSTGRSSSLGDSGHRGRQNGDNLAEATTSQAVRNVNNVRTRHPRHRSSWLGVTNESNVPSGRPRASRVRRAELFEILHCDSSDSDSDSENYISNLRLSSLMLRNIHSGTGRSRQLSVPQAESDLIRTLRLSAARVSYNVDRLTQHKGECSICLEDLAEGDVIARLPCLCIYHKKCIDAWFQRRPVCPEHPGD